MEPRARASRHKGSLNFGQDLEIMLTAFGAPFYPHDRSAANPHSKPYPETVRVLDEILTDFIIETCHSAVTVASYAGRTKLKMADFEWLLRKDPNKLGHIRAMFDKKRDIDLKKKAFDLHEGAGEAAKLGVENLTTLAEEVGEEGTGKGKGRGRGRKGGRTKRDLAEMTADANGDARDGTDDGDTRTDGGRSKKARSTRSETG